jgi:ubiquitin-protein ligase
MTMTAEDRFGALPMKYESPQVRRMRSDMAALEKLRAESSLFDFRSYGKPQPQRHIIEFRGKGLAQEKGKIVVRDRHEVDIKLGAAYPRTMPELKWITPIYHPNISAPGLVCLGGYGTHWVPSLQMDELCIMLWDMVRYHNYDVRSPYNREAALWAASQTSFPFPIDPRPLRDRRAALGRIDDDRLIAPIAFPDRIPEPEPIVPEKHPEVMFLD